MPNRPEDALISLAPPRSAEQLAPFLYRVPNALNNFESPSLSGRGADFASPARYVHFCAPDATKADEPGRGTAHDGTDTGGYDRKQADMHNPLPAPGRTVTCRCLWRSPHAAPPRRCRWSRAAQLMCARFPRSVTRPTSIASGKRGKARAGQRSFVSRLRQPSFRMQHHRQVGRISQLRGRRVPRGSR